MFERIEENEMWNVASPKAKISKELLEVFAYMDTFAGQPLTDEHELKDEYADHLEHNANILIEFLDSIYTQPLPTVEDFLQAYGDQFIEEASQAEAHH